MHDRTLTLVDFEYSGWTDQAFELADLVEHPQSHETADHAWDELIVRFRLTPQGRRRYAAARQLMCFFWLARWWPAPATTAPDRRFTRQAERAQRVLVDLLD